MLVGLYSVKGYFYGSKRKLYRRMLDIARKDCKITAPDLLVIMMNPGGSEPVSWKGALNNLVPASADRTQQKIMRFMLDRNFQYSRILNLSDICEKSSQEFYKNVKADINKNTHSLFCPSNRIILDSVFVENVPVLLAWGVEKILSPLANAALAEIKLRNALYFGDKRDASEISYYHPRKIRTKQMKNFREWRIGVNESYDKITQTK
jgi:hypothetical protein